MGLDQTLNWIGEPSKSQIERLKHKNLSEFNYTTGMSYISEEKYHDGQYQYIRKYMIPEEVFDTAFPDKWCEYKKKYRSLNCGYYPIVGLLSNMQKADSDFAKKYHEGINNIFYKGYW